MEMKHVEDENIFNLTMYYAKCEPVMRRPLWDILRHKSSTYTIPWCVIGDFNVIAFVEEKIGGIPYQMSKILDFFSMTEDSGLVDLVYYGHKYTGSNGRGPNSISWKRLDRGLVNDQWLTAFPATTVHHLASAGSDHNPLLMEINVRQEMDNRYFKFLNCWVDNEKFFPLVEEEYGDIFQKAKLFEQQVKDAEETRAQSNSDSDRITF
uniref:Craniofacial development protein 2-like n=2 Tax=Nicotiana TaxID=4085 RepID=A0A1S4AQR6_TOBAC|nr:PREDICTED: uncharacterized protein LOC104218348 [Nicotiana sylvestris]XP_016478926.1 PREDICTED: uncharacterized protein LOC107800291 [Nicotiana tabacum]